MLRKVVHAAVGALLVAAAPLLADGTVQNYCITSPNSVGPGALLHWTGPVNLREGVLVVTGAPPNSNGIFVWGSGRALTPFSKGYWCLPRPRYILAMVGTDGHGTSLLSLERLWALYQIPAIETLSTAGLQFSFQYTYADVDGSTPVANMTDAIAVEF